MADKPPSLRFAWWNTGVAPPWIESRASLEHRAEVRRIVEHLISNDGCGLIGLGEVRRESILDWVPSHQRADWAEIRDLSASRNDFDLGLLFDRGRLDAVDHLWVRARHAGNDVRAGLVVLFKTTANATPGYFVVVLAHWRADMGDIADAAARRSRAAQQLRGAICKQLDANGGGAVPHVLMLGDFNAEPFDPEFREDLPTSRLRGFVQNHSRRAGTDDLMLYNASWRVVGERYPWMGSTAPSLAGTYWTKQKLPTTWRTFDQVLVSGSLLGTSGWVFREDELRIGVNDEVFEPASAKFLSPSMDHLPIFGQLDWLDDQAIPNTSK